VGKNIPIQKKHQKRDTKRRETRQTSGDLNKNSVGGSGMGWVGGCWLTNMRTEKEWKAHLLSNCKKKTFKQKGFQRG